MNVRQKRMMPRPSPARRARALRVRDARGGGAVRTILVARLKKSEKRCVSHKCWGGAGAVLFGSVFLFT